MSYQVLARKWRPRSFGEMVGQEHVLKALVNALDHNRLHHAYLFTGTRGVGKTTVARILAKCLNCETGVGSTPCGTCSACVEINEGRFVDLIEVDAASRTKVEDTRELLDNVQYSPTNGRFKIYLIDEVHMLSNSSFNALLKTLEEPPAHVKFLLATTDPQKLPATILSRCLQFNLKNMSPEKIVQHLQNILQEEMVPFDDPALWQLARSADGSMRDALSLTDQAIAFGNGKLSEVDVTSMLGTIDHKFIQNILEALISLDGQKLLTTVSTFAEHAPDYASALADLQTLLHRIAIAQALPDALDNSYGDRQQILNFASQLAPEDVQLFYQTALMGQRDLSISPVPRTAFEMILLRMLAFKPQGLVDIPKKPLPASSQTTSIQTSASDNTASDNSVSDEPLDHQTTQPQENNVASAQEEPLPEKKPLTEEPENAAPPSPPVEISNVLEKTESEEETVEAQETEVLSAEAVVSDVDKSHNESKSVVEKPVAQADVVHAAVQAATTQTPSVTEQEHPKRNVAKTFSIENFQPENWIELFSQLPISGMVKLTASNLVCVGRQENQFYFVQDVASGGLLNKEHSLHLGDVLSDYFACPIKAHIEVSELDGSAETPAQFRERIKKEKKAAALDRLKNDPVIQSLQAKFDARVLEDSIELIEEKS